jgi:hypothetical protein
MFERGIQRAAVEKIIATGVVIEEYPADKPFPGFLMMGHSDGTMFHVVVATDVANSLCHVITVYTPDSVIWDNDGKIRRQK